MSVYVIDTNFLIQAHRSTYPLDVFPSFWNKIRQLAEENRIISIDKVKQEIYKHNDDLKLWCEENLPPAFFNDTPPFMAAYAQVVAWATSRSDHYNQNALNEFLDADEADAFLIAFCLADIDNLILVTQETSEPLRKNKIKIPDSCQALNINQIGIMDMFRQLREVF
jgi:hypothetical protein